MSKRVRDQASDIRLYRRFESGGPTAYCPKCGVNAGTRDCLPWCSEACAEADTDVPQLSAPRSFQRLALDIQPWHATSPTPTLRCPFCGATAPFDRNKHGHVLGCRVRRCAGRRGARQVEAHNFEHRSAEAWLQAIEFWSPQQRKVLMAELFKRLVLMGERGDS